MLRSRKLGVVTKFHRWKVLGRTRDVVGRCVARWSRPARSGDASVCLWVVSSASTSSGSLSSCGTLFPEQVGSLVSGFVLAGDWVVPLLVAAQKKGGVAEKIMDGMWQAYGKPLKVMACIALFVLVGLPLLSFIRKTLQ